ncbi:MAG: BtpA/SgcQ family protein [Bacteroidota bacterium]
MIHVQALPGTPKHRFSPADIIQKAVGEARIYAESGFDAIMIENMHDVPYPNRGSYPEITAMMTMIGQAVKAETNLPCGIQILAGANQDALAVALAADLQFIRAEGFIFSHIADEGLMHGDAADLMRYRKAIGAEHIMVLTDIKKKHSSHQITADISLIETAKAAAFFLSDGIIVTGTSTGRATDPAEVRQLKDAIDLPILVGSGITADNVAEYVTQAHGLIVGSWLKEGGHWTGNLSPERAKRLVEIVRNIRQ